MKLTSNSLNLIPFFLKDKDIYVSDNPTGKLNKIMEQIYHDLLQAYSFLQTIKKKKNGIGIELYEITIKKITNIYHINLTFISSGELKYENIDIIIEYIFIIYLYIKMLIFGILRLYSIR